jgi:hypothetical protein
MAVKHQPAKLHHHKHVKRPGNRFRDNPDVLVKGCCTLFEKRPKRVGDAKNKIPKENGIVTPETRYEQPDSKENRSNERNELKNIT